MNLKKKPGILYAKPNSVQLDYLILKVQKYFSFFEIELKFVFE